MGQAFNQKIGKLVRMFVWKLGLGVAPEDVMLCFDILVKRSNLFPMGILWESVERTVNKKLEGIEAA